MSLNHIKSFIRLGLVAGVIFASVFAISFVNAQVVSSVYEDTVLFPWSPNSFRGFYDYANTSRIFRGTTAIFASSSLWGGISFSTQGVPQSTVGQGYFEFSAYSQASFRIYPLLWSKGKMIRSGVNPVLPANQWTTFSIPLSKFIGLASGTIDRVDIMNDGFARVWHVDSVGFSTTPTGVTNTIAEKIFPTVALSGVVQGGSVLGTVQLNATASDNAGVSRLQIKIDGIVRGFTSISPESLTYAWDTTKLTNGPHTVQAVAIDGWGNSTASFPITLLVNNPVASSPNAQPLVLYSDIVVLPWVATSSRGVMNLQTTERAYRGSASIKMNTTATGKVMFSTLSPVNMSQYRYLEFAVYSTGTQRIYPMARVNGKFISLSSVLTLPNQWKLFSLPLPVTITTSSAAMDYFEFRSDGYSREWFIDEIRAASTSSLIDITPPVISLTSPLPGTNLSGLIVLSAFATDDVKVLGVQFKVDGVRVGVEDFVAPYSMMWNSRSATKGTHTVWAEARDAARNRSVTQLATITVSAVPDLSAPTVPIGLLGRAISSTQIDLSWYVARDNIGVVGYRVYQNGANIGTATSTRYSNRDLTASTTYAYQVSALDAAGNESIKSSTITVRTLGIISTSTVTTTTDRTAPIVSVTAPSSSAVLSGTVLVQVSATDNVGVAGVQFQLDGANLMPEDTSIPYEISWDTKTIANGIHELKAIARDVVGHRTVSSAILISVSNFGEIGGGGGGGGGGGDSGDTIAPSAPTNLLTRPVSSSQINLSWTASTDNIGVTGYYIYRGGTQITTVNTTSYENTGLTAATAYAYAVSAYDAAGNVSAQSVSVSGTTQTVSSGGIIVDYSSVNTWNQIPTTTIQSASSLRLMLRHASVGENLNNGLNTLQAQNSLYNRSNWLFQNRGNPGWSEKISDFSTQVGLQASNFDVMTMKFCYVDFQVNFENYRQAMETLELANPGKKFVWWTMPVMTGSNALIQAFNSNVRNYAVQNNKILFDVASVESHRVDETSCVSSGIEVLCSEYSTDGGHPNTTIGEERIAKAYWYLMARLTGWNLDLLPADTTSPSIPASLAVTPISSSQLNLSWIASTDNIGVTGYRIYRNGTQIGTSNVTSYQNTGLTAATAYTYTVSAYDAAGNISAQSVGVSATTQSIIVPPTPTSTATSTKFKTGDRIQVTTIVNVRATPTIAGTILGTQTVGILGSVVGGPTSADGYVWWNINYDANPDGWSTESYLQLAPTSTSVVSPSVLISSPVNNAVISVGAVPVLLDLYSKDTLRDFVWNWNGQNYTIYNSALVLLLNLDNISSLNENAASTRVTDVSSYGNNGTCTNLGIGCPWTIGKYGNAMNFTGTTGNILINTNASLNVLNRHTVEFWMNPRANTLTSTIFNKMGEGEGFRIIRLSDGRIAYNLANGRGLGYTDLISNQAIPVNTWTHIAVAYNGIVQRMYVDGVLQPGSVNTTAFIPNTISPLEIGYASCCGILNGYNGLLDEVKVWNRALSATEIQQAYASAFRKYDATGWSFESNQINLPSGTYTLSASAVDTLGNTNTSGVRTVTVNPLLPADTTSPSIPASLAVTPISSSQLNLSWIASTDNIGVTGYRIYRNGTQIGTSNVTSYQNTGLTAATAYTYTVSAYDAAGNVSAQSVGVSATTQSIIVPPTPTSTATSTKFKTGDRIQVTTIVNVRATPTTAGTILGTQTVGILGSVVGGPTSADGYVWWNINYDANPDGWSIENNLSLFPTSTDTVTPSIPAGLAVASISSSQLNLSWIASTDNIGVTGYRIYRNGTQIGTSNVTSYQNTGLTASTAYTYTVSAYDAAGNVSAQSVGVSATTQTIVIATSTGNWTGIKNINHDYPRIYVLQWGGGSPEWLSKFDMVISVKPATERIRKAKALNPNAYYLVTTDWNQGGPFWNDQGNNVDLIPDQWYVKDPNGVRVNTSGGVWGFTDISDYGPNYTGQIGPRNDSIYNEKYNQALPRVFMNNFTDWTVWDGFVSDGTWNAPTTGAPVDLDLTHLNDWTEHGSNWVRDAWSNGYNKVWTYIRNNFPSKLGGQGLIAYHTILPINGEFDIANNPNGFMGDNIVNGIGSEATMHGNPYWCFNDYMFASSRLESVGPQPQIDWISGDFRAAYDVGNTTFRSETSIPMNSNYLPPATAPDNAHAKNFYRYMRWQLGWALLKDVYFSMEDNEHWYYLYYDEYDAKLGYPKGPATKLSNSAYVRFFDNGAVIVNPDNSINNPVTVTDAMISGLPGYAGPYYKFKGNQDPVWNDGSQFTSIYLPSNIMSYAWYKCNRYFSDGIILVRQPNTAVISDIIVDNAYSGTSPGSETATMPGFTWDSAASNDNNPTWFTGGNTDSPYNAQDVLWHRSFTAPANSGASATFRPQININGRFNVYEWHGYAGAAENSIAEATNVLTTIRHANGTTAITINQRINAGRWNLLGNFNYTAGGNWGVTIGTNGADGTVIADAFKFEYVGP